MTLADLDDDATLVNEAGALAALIGSRICHDLVNPVGAISNGVELLSMAPVDPDGPEIALVSESVAHAAARLRFFRVAFGVASPNQMLGRSETALILADTFGDSRMNVDWSIAEDQPRILVKVAFLLLQCIETALPRGGDVHVSANGDAWRVEVSSDRLQADAALWSLLDGKALPETLRPAEVQFALAPRAAAGIGRKITARLAESQITLEF